MTDTAYYYFPLKLKNSLLNEYVILIIYSLNHFLFCFSINVMAYILSLSIWSIYVMIIIQLYFCGMGTCINY